MAFTSFNDYVKRMDEVTPQDWRQPGLIGRIGDRLRKGGDRLFRGDMGGEVLAMVGRLAAFLRVPFRPEAIRDAAGGGPQGDGGNYADLSAAEQGLIQIARSMIQSKRGGKVNVGRDEVEAVLRAVQNREVVGDDATPESLAVKLGGIAARNGMTLNLDPDFLTRVKDYYVQQRKDRTHASGMSRRGLANLGKIVAQNLAPGTTAQVANAVHQLIGNLNAAGNHAESAKLLQLLQGLGGPPAG